MEDVQLVRFWLPDGDELLKDAGIMDYVREEIDRMLRKHLDDQLIHGTTAEDEPTDEELWELGEVEPSPYWTIGELGKEEAPMVWSNPWLDIQRARERLEREQRDREYLRPRPFTWGVS